MDQAEDISDEFLAELVAELDHEDIVGITLSGSYARREATRYSDVDLACFWRAGLKPPPKHMFYRHGRLISVKKTTVAEMRALLDRPEAALRFVSGKHRLLLDKDGSVARLLQELEDFRWETLQPAAHASIGPWMMLMAEEVHKVLREFQQDNEPGLVYAVAKLVSELTLIAALYKGVLITGDSTYFRQVEAATGNDSNWTRAHRIARGLEDGPEGIEPVRARGIAVLHLYRTTLELTREVLESEHLAVAEQALVIAREAASQLPFSEEEQAWLKRWI